MVAATKMDKLARTKRGAGAPHRREGAGPAEPGSAVPFSAEEGTGADALWARINSAGRGAGPDEAGDR